jgi:preprotein translocase subunit SecE
MADENETERDDDQDEDGGSSSDGGSTAGDDEREEESNSPTGGQSETQDRDESDDARQAREERELRRDSEQAAREDEARREDDLPITGTLGLERWVQFAFIAVAVALVYVTDKIVTFTWEFFAEPDPTIVTITAVAVSLGVSYALYQNMRVRDFAFEVVSEMSKVTWPTRDETWYSTLVVIGASFVAAVYTGLLDALWSALTDLVYRV